MQKILLIKQRFQVLSASVYGSIYSSEGKFAFWGV